MQAVVSPAERFYSANPDIAAWVAASPRFEFAQSLHEQVRRRGALSEKQIEAARRCIERSKAAQEREAAAPAATLARVEQAFASAKENGLLRPKLTIGGLRLSPAPATGVNAGAIYAKQVDDGAYLGKFIGGRFVRSGLCTSERQAQLLSIAADPFAAAVDHGKLTGACAACSRPLSDPESVQRGIGPICAKKYGWL